MNVIQRIRFPHKSDISDLYIRSTGKKPVILNASEESISLERNETLSLNTYFNSFYELFYAKHTILTSPYCVLNLKGNFKIQIYREQHGKSKKLISKCEYEECKKENGIKIAMPDLHNNEIKGRVYLEITCLGENGLFCGGYIATNQDKDKEVALGIIICTFKRENNVKKIIKTILEDNNLANKDYEVLIVDIGKTIKQDTFQNKKVRLIANKNSGGSGGFARGLIEALRNQKYTHFLLMDDDIEFDSESIYRLFSLYEYGREDFAIAGSMMDLYEKNTLVEAGALCHRRISAFMPTLLKNRLSLQNPTNLNYLLVEEKPDYGGFWFFSFSKKVISKIGLPSPFFIRRDDMEFCLRVKKHSQREIIPFPSIAVWHKVEFAITDTYYIIRNSLILQAIHYDFGYFRTIGDLTWRLLNWHILRFDYNSAESFIKGFEDYLKGPKFIKNIDPEANHSDVARYIRKHPDWTPIQEGIVAKYGEKIPVYMKIKKLFMVFILEKTAGIKILIKWLKVAIKNKSEWYYIRDKWKKLSPDFTTVEFWNQYLGLE